MAAAAITPRLSETAFIPANFPGVSFTVILLRCHFLGIFSGFVPISNRISGPVATIQRCAASALSYLLY
jgi:hypothetical protein